MRILILCFLLFSLNGFANYMSEVDKFDCDKIGRTVYLKKQSCDLSHADCVSLRAGFNCRTDSEQDTSVDNINSPIIAKRDLETCVDDDACQVALAAKVCSNPLLVAIKRLDLDPKEIYCPEQIGFNQMIIRLVRVDVAKKAAWDINSLNPVVKRASRQTRRDEIVAEISNMDIVTLPQLRVIVEKMMRDKYTKN